MPQSFGAGRGAMRSHCEPACRGRWQRPRTSLSRSCSSSTSPSSPTERCRTITTQSCRFVFKRRRPPTVSRYPDWAWAYSWLDGYYRRKWSDEVGHVADESHLLPLIRPQNTHHQHPIEVLEQRRVHPAGNLGQLLEVLVDLVQRAPGDLGLLLVIDQVHVASDHRWCPRKDSNLRHAV